VFSDLPSSAPNFGLGEGFGASERRKTTRAVLPFVALTILPLDPRFEAVIFDDSKKCGFNRVIGRESDDTGVRTCHFRDPRVGGFEGAAPSRHHESSTLVPLDKPADTKNFDFVFSGGSRGL
jgi:hypothetical protein